MDVELINQELASASAEQIVVWSAGQFGKNLVMSSSFGAESAVLLHMANQALPGIRVIMVDTGYLFPQTWEFMEQLRQRMDLNVWIYRTKNDPVVWLGQNQEHDPTQRRDIERCCAINKNEPFERAMKQLAPAGWLRGIRRQQAQTRQDRQVVEWAARYQCLAISPLLGWTGKQVHEYMQKYQLPYHPLREKGYLSIGCNPLSCTRPIAPGEDPRAGRWSGAGKVECGINLTNSLDSARL